MFNWNLTPITLLAGLNSQSIFVKLCIKHALANALRAQATIK